MAGLDEIGDEEFVGYIFRGPPERRPRLWFLDRHLSALLAGVGHAVTADGESGIWCATTSDIEPVSGAHIRYEHHGPAPWSAVWQLTDTTIPHVHTFGRDEDVWRLCIWPD